MKNKITDQRAPLILHLYLKSNAFVEHEDGISGFEANLHRAGFLIKHAQIGSINFCDVFLHKFDSDEYNSL